MTSSAWSRPVSDMAGIANKMQQDAATRRAMDQFSKKEMHMTDEQIKHMVNRFLGWKLPQDFHPDCGIHFDADSAKKLDPRNSRYEPTGTNLFTHTQAEAMVRYMLGGDAK